VAVQALGQVAITYIPAMNTLFETAPIGVGAWARLLLVAAGGSLVVAADKKIRRLATGRR
jgi:cation-transporting ATPase F